MKEVEGLLWGE